MLIASSGRHLLAQSVLSSISLYTMQSTLFPKGVYDQIDKVVRRFIWGGTVSSSKIPLIR